MPEPSSNTPLLTGVIEGFYGPPWSRAERLELFDWLAAGGLNTYLYAPKDDLKHRAFWRTRYSDSEAEELRTLIQACTTRGLRFIYALSPGLDIRYSSATDRATLRERFEQMHGLGCQNFCLLFDDIPDLLDPEDLRRWGSLASAQADVANELFAWVRDRESSATFLFCPTPYCGRMAAAGLGGSDYLETLGASLAPEIHVFWTGPEIISREISVEHVTEVARRLCRKPLLWDNLHANDYDGRRFYVGPYAGRPAELRNVVSGVLLNPNTEFPLNFVPIRTLAEFLRRTDTWDHEAAYYSAMREWLHRFATFGQPVAWEDLVLLGDCYYLPHQFGPKAQGLFDLASRLLTSEPETWGDEAAAFCQQAAPLRLLCARLTELRDRSLFYALSRRIWELREELDLLEKYVSFRAVPENAGKPFHSDFHLPGTYRGGFVADLQPLLAQQPDGSFNPVRTTNHLQP